MLENFRSYNKALELFEICEGLSAQSHLKSQLSRASLSVVLNLCEGSARVTSRDRAKFYSIAYASLREVQTLLRILKCERAFLLADELGGMIYCLRKASSFEI